VITSDLRDGQNFFTGEPWEHWDIQVTNPPYGVKYEWLARSYAHGRPFAVLVPVDTIGAAAGQRLFDRYGAEFLYLRPRVNFIMPNKGDPLIIPPGQDKPPTHSAQFPVMWWCWKLLPVGVMTAELYPWCPVPAGDAQRIPPRKAMWYTSIH
jgi:hypothetical protein